MTTALRDSYETLLLERPHPDVLLVTMNRPDVMNATSGR